MGSDLSVVLQTSVNAPDSVVQNHQRIVADARRRSSTSGGPATANGRGRSYTFEDDPMNYAELRFMAAEDAKAFVRGDGHLNARAGSLERAGAGGNKVLMLEPSCDTNSMAGVSSDTAGMAARAKGYAELRQALKDPLMAGRVGIAVDSSVKLGGRIPAQSGRYTQCASLLLANILLAAEGGVEEKKKRYTLPAVTFYALDLREGGLDDESGAWIIGDIMERVQRVFRYHVGLRHRQRQKHRQHALFPGAAALNVYTGTPRANDDDDDDDDEAGGAAAGGSKAQRDVKIQLPVFTKDTRGDLFCCSIQHILLDDNNIEIGGVLKVLNTLLEAVAPKGYAPKGEDWMLLPHLCLIDLQRQDVLPSQIKQYLLEYVPPTRQVTILVSATPEAEWKSTKEREEMDRRMGVTRARSASATRRRSSRSRGREKVDSPADFKQLYILQDRTPPLDGAALDDLDSFDDPAAADQREEAEGAAAASSASSIAFHVEETDSVAPPPPPMAPVPASAARTSPSPAAPGSRRDEEQQKRLREESDAYVESQRSRRQSLVESQRRQQQQEEEEEAAAAARRGEEQQKRLREDAALQRQIQEEEERLATERQRLAELRKERAAMTDAVDEAAARNEELRATRDEKLRALQSQRQDLQRQQREMYEEQEREALDEQLARRDRRQQLPQDQQVVILRERPQRRSSVDVRALEERLQQLFEEEQAIYREYAEAVDEPYLDDERERAYEERQRESQQLLEQRNRQREAAEASEERLRAGESRSSGPRHAPMHFSSSSKPGSRTGTPRRRPVAAKNASSDDPAPAETSARRPPSPPPATKETAKITSASPAKKAEPKKAAPAPPPPPPPSSSTAPLYVQMTPIEGEERTPRELEQPIAAVEEEDAEEAFISSPSSSAVPQQHIEEEEHVEQHVDEEAEEAGDTPHHILEEKDDDDDDEYVEYAAADEEEEEEGERALREAAERQVDAVSSVVSAAQEDKHEGASADDDDGWWQHEDASAAEGKGAAETLEKDRAADEDEDEDDYEYDDDDDDASGAAAKEKEKEMEEQAEEAGEAAAAPAVGQAAQAPFHDPRMHSLRPTGPLYGQPRLHHQHYTPSPAHESPSHHHADYGFQHSGSTPPLSPPPPGSYFGHVDPAVAREREEKAQNFRDRRYDKVAPRVSTRWEGGADRPTPPEGYVRPTTPRTSRSRAATPSRQLRATSPHPGIAGRSASRRRGSSVSAGASARGQSQPPLLPATPAVSDADAVGSDLILSPMTPVPAGRTGRGSTPRPVTETAASRARRDASRQRLRKMEERDAPFTPRHSIRRGRGRSPAAPSLPRRRSGTTTDASEAAAREESPMPKPVMVDARDMITSGRSDDNVSNNHYNNANVNGGVADPRKPTNANVNGYGWGADPALVNTPQDARGALRPTQGSSGSRARSIPDIDAPPGWTAPMVHPKLRTVRPSQRR